MKYSVVSAPGKILWIGEYSVLERPNISFVTAVNGRVFAKVDSLDDNRIVLSVALPQSLIEVEGKIRGGGIVFSDTLDKLEEEYTRFTRTAVEICVKFLREKGENVSGIRLTTVSDPAFAIGGQKTGLGGSAAATVATVAAILDRFGFDAYSNIEKVHRISQLAHSITQGKIGSGFDVACSTFGSCIYSRYSTYIIENISNVSDASVIANVIESEWDYSLNPMTLPQGFFPLLAFTNRSVTTSQMVNKVISFKTKQPQYYEVLIKKLNYINQKAVDELQRICKFSEEKPEIYGQVLNVLNNAVDVNGTRKLRMYLNLFRNFRGFLKQGRLLAKELGIASGAPIESDEFTEIIEDAEVNGAFIAKLVGAGGGDIIAAICLSDEKAKMLANHWKSIGYTILDRNITNSGIQRESAKAFDQALKKNAISFRTIS